MPLRVQQHVADRIPDLRRCRQKAEVVAVCEHRPGSFGDAIHRPCDACGDRLHAASERVAVACFDDQVRVIALEGVVHEPETGPSPRDSKTSLQLADDGNGPKRWQAGPDAQCDVRGQGRSKDGARCVRKASMGTPLPTGAVTSTSPTPLLREGKR